MRPTRLILVEGAPGSGKSTTAARIARCLDAQGIPARWWYEEEAGHPVYVFRDRAALARTVADLAGGEYRRVVAAALRRWRRFAAAVADSEAVVILDGCLFGYLAWSLFPFDVPEGEILDYVGEVGRILAPLDPALIYFRQDNLAASLRRVCERRGGDTERRLIERSVQTPYGRRHGLEGFAGLVAYWRAYRRLTDDAFADIPFPAVAIETSAGDWGATWRQARAFLDLPPLAEAAVAADLDRFVGAYRYNTAAGAGVALVGLDEGGLFLDGVPQVWPRNRLAPLGGMAFAVESLPFTATFVEDGACAIAGMIATGPPLLSGAIPRVFIRDRA